MRYREMKAVLAVLERADGRFHIQCMLAEPPDGDWWVAVRDRVHGTDHQIGDYKLFRRTFPELECPALAVLAPSLPRVRLTWADVVRLLPRLEGYYPAGLVDKIVQSAEGGYHIDMRDARTRRGFFICRADDLS